MDDLSKQLAHFLLFSLLSPILFYPVQYTRHELKNPLRTIHHFKVDPKQERVELVNGSDSAVGIETVSSIAKRKGALLAVNGGYFQGGPLLGAPDGPFKINGVISGSSYSPSGALGWKENGTLSLIDRITIHSSLNIAQKSFPITAINRSIHEDSAIFFTPNFNRTTLSPAGTLELEITQNKISSILGKKGSSIIPPFGGIYSVGKKRESSILQSLAGKPAQIWHSIKPVFSPEKAGLWNMVDHIVNGALILFNKKKCSSESLPQNTYKSRHARTAIGIDAKQIWHICVVEAHHKGREGMTMSELADWMSSIGCHYAIALDGGGSSTVYYLGKTNQIITHKNHPYMQNNVYYHPDGGERPIGNAIIIKKR